MWMAWLRRTLIDNQHHACCAQPPGRVVVCETTTQYVAAAIAYTSPTDACLEIGCHEGKPGMCMSASESDQPRMPLHLFDGVPCPQHGRLADGAATHASVGTQPTSLQARFVVKCACVPKACRHHACRRNDPHHVQALPPHGWGGQVRNGGGGCPSAFPRSHVPRSRRV
jgi:hypothetical protein